MTLEAEVSTKKQPRLPATSRWLPLKLPFYPWALLKVFRGQVSLRQQYVMTVAGSVNGTYARIPMWTDLATATVLYKSQIHLPIWNDAEFKTAPGVRDMSKPKELVTKIFAHTTLNHMRARLLARF